MAVLGSKATHESLRSFYRGNLREAVDAIDNKDMPTREDKMVIASCLS